MKVVQINTTCGIGSTGKICVAVSELLTRQGIENYILYTQGESDYPLGIKFAGKSYKKVQALKSRVFGNYGFNSQQATRKLIGHLERIQPDIVHLHNIHGHDCDLEMLFRYLKTKSVKLFWTFHDCWAFTGYCTYFDMVGCPRWKESCGGCPQRKGVTWFFDRSRELHERKKELFSGLDLTIITPSHWLAGLVKESFLKDYPVKVIHNGIDLSVFKPTESDFRKKHNCGNKYVLLGVAFGWGARKGLDVFAELAKRLDESYQIVLVGTDDKVDKLLPKNIISIHRTQNQKELAEIYTAADIFVNPTREENYPTVNMESIACGTPVLTFRTGGSPEIPDEHSGCVVRENTAQALLEEVHKIRVEQMFSVEDCLKRAESFDAEYKFEEYVRFYEKLMK